MSTKMSDQPLPVGFDPETAGNFEDMEKQFAVKAVQHMLTYWSILERMRGSALKLTKMDDEIYEHLQKEFPDLDVAETINEDQMKSKEGKERWRNFVMQYEDKIEDYNFGTMLRSNPKFEYTEKDSIFGNTLHDHLRTNIDLTQAVRMQFYAIEIARNRKGLNDWIYEEASAKESK